MGERKCILDFGGGKASGRDHLEDVGVDRRVIIK
jgi:hypothetical protein